MTGCAVNDPWSEHRVIGVVNNFLSCLWVKLSGSQQPNPTMTALCVTPHGPLFLGLPTGEITFKTFGPQTISVIIHMPALYIHVLSIITMNLMKLH